MPRPKTHSDADPWIDAAVDAYEGPLLRYARRITGDLERARDVVQDCFMRLCRAERGRVEAHLAEWLFTVCRNRALDVCRKEGRMTTIDERGFSGVEATHSSPPATLERGETVSRALDLLDRLPAKQQECIRLKFQGGLSYKEISRITNHSVSHVGVLIHQGMKSLRSAMGAVPRQA